MNASGEDQEETMTNGEQEEKPLEWWQLSLLGVACTIGTGYFLGTGIALKIGGPSVLFAFILAAVGTYLVFDALSRMTAAEPLQGSFRSYAKKAYGRWAGFTSGWVYWASELLIMGSQMTALSIFSRFWFPSVPLWVFAAIYAVMGLAVICAGTKGFERLENVFAVMKIAAIVMFLAIASAALLGWLGRGSGQAHVPQTLDELFPNGWKGMWSALIFAFYAFGGIEILGIMAMRLRDPKDAPRSGKIMLILLTSIYVVSVGLAVTLISWRAFHSNKSPFVTALGHYNLPFIPHVFNAVLLIAGFSTMVASLFAITTMLVTLAEDGDAPPTFAKKGFRRLPLRAIGLTAAGLVVSVVLALLMPGRIYEYFTTAAGLMLLYNWSFILITAGKILKLSGWGQTKRFTGLFLLLLAVSGTLFHSTSRPGFFISLLFIAVIGGLTLIMIRIWRKDGQGQSHSQHPDGFSKHKINGLKAKIKSKAD
jgi:L-asparagine transporter-like permease